MKNLFILIFRTQEQKKGRKGTEREREMEILNQFHLEGRKIAQNRAVTGEAAVITLANLDRGMFAHFVA